MLHISTHHLAEQIAKSIAEDTPELIDNLKDGCTSSFRIDTEIQGKPVVLRIIIAESEFDRVTTGGEPETEPDTVAENPDRNPGESDLISEAQSIAKHACANCRNKHECSSREDEPETEPEDEPEEPYLSAGYDTLTGQYELKIEGETRGTIEELLDKNTRKADPKIIYRALFEKLWDDNKEFFENIPDFGNCCKP